MADAWAEVAWQMTAITLLGPQRQQTTFGQVVQELGLKPPLAAITAGWQEREAEVEQLEFHLGDTPLNLRLHERGEDVFRLDPEFREAHRQHQSGLKRLQSLYRIRLSHLQTALFDLMRRKNFAPEFLEPEIEDALEMLRALDRHHLDRVAKMDAAFRQQWPCESRPAVMKHRSEIAAILSECGGLLIAGGHVAIILNRMRLFGLKDMIRTIPVVAWSAGAMAISEDIVLFHDSPPQGKGIPEVLEKGLGLVKNLIVLPHASKRLHTNDPVRVAIFARRFKQAHCVTLDPGSRLTATPRGWLPGPHTKVLTAQGDLQTREVL